MPRVASIVASAAVVAGLALVAGALASPASARAVQGHDDHGSSFEVRLGGSQVGGPAVAGVPAAPRPWVLREGEAKVDKGVLTVEVEGLVIPPPAGSGLNPLAAFKASVACGGVVVDTTAAVAVGPAGDAEFSEAVTLPAVCDAPAVLIHNAANTGFYIAAGQSAD